MRLRVRICTCAFAVILPGCPPDEPEAESDWVSRARGQIHGDSADVDLDGNSKSELHIVERWPDGRPKKETLDYDENGTADAWIDYDSQGYFYVSDLDHDGRADSARSVTLSEDGKWTEIQVLDSNHDGELDERITNIRHAASALIEHTVELYYDGEFWQLETSTLSVEEAYAASTIYKGPAGPLKVDTNCGAHGPDIAAAYAEALSRGRDCLGKISPTMATDFEKAVADRPATEITCTGSSSYSGYAPNAEDPTMQEPLVIDLTSTDPDALAPSTIFHEALHYAFGIHRKGDGTTDPQDQVWGCERYCFEVKSGDNCEACLGATAGGVSDECSGESNTHPCPNAPKARCFTCAGMEVDANRTKQGERCGKCNGTEMLMRRGEICCGSMKCDVGSICGDCGGQPFCSSMANPMYCAKCGEGPRVLPVGQRCCPPDNPTWNPTRKQCEAPCPGGSESGGDAAVTRNFELGLAAGSFEFAWNTYTIRDRMIVRYEKGVLFDTGCVGETGSIRLDYSGAATFVSIEVEPDCAGEIDTEWDFQVACP